MAVTVRDAVPADADRIAMLLTQLGYPATGSEVAGRLRYWLDDPLLVAAAEETARGWGCLAVEVTSTRSRPEAHPFYRRLGFTDRCSQAARYWKTLLAHLRVFRQRSARCDPAVGRRP